MAENETEAGIGYGGSIEYSDDGAAYTAIPQVVDIECPDWEIPEDKVSSNDGPVTHEFLPKMIEPGSLKFNVIFTSTIYAQLMSIQRVMKTWRVTDPDGSTFIQNGFIKSAPKKQPMDSHDEIAVVVKLSGTCTYNE